MEKEQTKLAGDEKGVDEPDINHTNDTFKMCMLDQAKASMIDHGLYGDSSGYSQSTVQSRRSHTGNTNACYVN